MPSLERFDHLHVYVRDRAMSEIWYKNTLGLHRSKDLEFWAAEGGPLTLQNESGSIHLAIFERNFSGLRPALAFGVGAIEFKEWIYHLRKCGLKDLAPVDHAVSWSLYFKDPDDNSYEITTYEYQTTAKLLQLDLLLG